ncbi:hypothetical protein PIB30_065189 [Stylosanthes scabra]|uniref:Uncharacterized protein n=1 Tax=Stylosanthes scabra TaxID=79078 RepID=A0ABU6YMQ5_9FABA|nr:hypothetical protein [Stylosanthes scabra]
MANNYDDMFNEALYSGQRRRDNTLMDNWIDEYLLDDSDEKDISSSSTPTPPQPQISNVSNPSTTTNHYRRDRDLKLSGTPFGVDLAEREATFSCAPGLEVVVPNTAVLEKKCGHPARGSESDNDINSDEAG